MKILGKDGPIRFRCRHGVHENVPCPDCQAEQRQRWALERHARALEKAARDGGGQDAETGRRQREGARKGAGARWAHLPDVTDAELAGAVRQYKKDHPLATWTPACREVGRRYRRSRRTVARRVKSYAPEVRALYD